MAQRSAHVRSGSLFATAEKRLPADCRVTGYLLSCWLWTWIKGLHRAHPWLAKRFDLSALRTAQSTQPAGRLRELQAYFEAIRARAPPRWRQHMLRLVGDYHRAIKRFLFGIPAQERMGQSTH